MQTLATIFTDAVRNRTVGEKSREALARLIETPPPRSRGKRLFSQLAAELYGYTGALDDSAACLETAVEAGLADVFWMDRSPVLDGLRSRPRFVELRAIVRRPGRVVRRGDEHQLGASRDRGEQSLEIDALVGERGANGNAAELEGIEHVARE